ncbi:MAG: cation-translocating P-type ATPase, partial [Gammaproteobacteria bacterium]|nr:cation-translocating P-type ATPase [Gammaproteobacteria bacterium]
HPVAKALHHLNQEKQVKAKNVINHVGLGLEGTVSQGLMKDGSVKDVWRFGRYEFVAKFINELSSSETEIVKQARSGRYSISYLSQGNKLVAIFLFEDSLREGNEQPIQYLISRGIKPVILSGDTLQSVFHVANALGIDEYQSGLSPQQKMEWVIQQQKEGKVVAMAGDGINDAPTLASADVSFSLADSTALANNHSDFLLLGGDLNSIPVSIKIAHKTLTLIKQNISWAIIYNVIAIPFAMAGWVSPWMAAIGMSASSVVVVLNSMRLAKI